MGKNKLSVAYACVSTIMFFLTFAIQRLSLEGNLEWSFLFISINLGISLICGILTGLLCAWLVQKSFVVPAKTVEGEEHNGKGFPYFYVGGISFLLLLLAWLPLFLAYYPGICAYDSSIQLGQIASGAWNEHHPVIHTLFMGFCIRFGRNVLGSGTAGIACYTVLQSMLLAAVMSYSMVVLYKLLCKSEVKSKAVWSICGVLQFIYMFQPFHAYMAISVTKDTMFSIFSMLMIVALVSIVFLNKGALGLDYLWFGLGLIGSIWFRNNGRYAVMVLIAFLLFARSYLCITRKKAGYYWKMFLYTVICTVLSIVFLSSLHVKLNVTQGDRREMLSIPIQQLARTMLYHGGIGMLPEDDNTISVEDKQIINEFLLNESYKEYRQEISDPVKRHTNTYVVRHRSKEFIVTYVRLFLKHPQDYVNAFLGVNAGFLDIADRTHANINIAGEELGHGYIQTKWVEEAFAEQGIYKDSKFPGLYEKAEVWAGKNKYLDIPVIGYLLRPGIWFWICAGIMITAIIRKKYNVLLPMGYLAGYYLTMFFGPTVQMRYVFPVMLIIPFLIVVCWLVMRGDT